jgi:predicted secreted hydrolase
MKRFLILPAVLLAPILAALLPAQNPTPFEVALPGYHFLFPRDNFNHPGYQTEWWYYTGNVWTPQGRRFGFELTFFRVGVSRPAHPDSVWSVDDVYTAHLALSDVQGQRFYYTERFNRAGPRLAGASQARGKIWNGNWQIVWTGNRQDLRAVADQFSLQFILQSSKPPVIQGVNGVSQKAAGRSQAPHYISLTRLVARGTIRLQSQLFTVSGTAWMDHEFFTQKERSTISRWDWVYLQLNDNTELMFYRIHQPDGGESPYSSGTYVEPDGSSQHLTAKAFQMQPESGWTSPETHAVYPVSWRIMAPSLRIRLEVTTPMKRQELVSRNRLVPTYWEGAVDVSGTKGQKTVRGVGYLEMTGYAPNISSPK